MKKHAKHKKHLLKMGLIAGASLVWFIIRTGKKPSRITYPCQKAAIANVHVFLLALFTPLLDFGKFKVKLPRIFNHRLIKTLVLLGSLFLAFGPEILTLDLFNGNYSPIGNNSNYLPVPLNLKPHNSLTSVNSSNLFFVENASGFEGNMDTAVSALFRLMENNSLFFFKTTSQPAGLIGKDDVVLIKVNCQWSQRGGTNTDLVKSLIKKIVNHPEGFTGEIVVADNGQGVGSLDWGASNAFNYFQSMKDVVDTFSSFKVSTWLWDNIRTKSVNEYDQGDFTDGYIVNFTRNPTTNIRVSYPKFKTKYDTYISFKKGIWNNTAGSYNLEKLKVINVPVLKSHRVYAVTACVKNYMGVVSQALTNAHYTVGYGGMGTEMVETRVPVLNILDSIWVNPIPMGGPETSYAAASFTNVIGASLDPVGLEYWASKHILIPAAIQRGYTQYSSLDPDYAPITPGLSESYHNYLERSMNELKKAGYQVTTNETEMNVYVSTPTYALTITTTVGGTTDPTSGIYTYTADSAVQVTAVPEANYLFDHWELDSVNIGSANPFTVLMNKNQTLKAVFSPIPFEFTLAIHSLPTGVTFTVDGVSHTTPWSGTYDENTSVSLEMPEMHSVEEARYYWSQWNDVVTSRSRTVTMNTNITLTAHYSGLYYELTVTSSPITGITLAINGVPKTTPYTEWLIEGSYTIEMPRTYNGYVWSHWLEDGDTKGIKTITLNGTTWTGIFVPAPSPPPVGGYSFSIEGHTLAKPLTPYLAMIAILTIGFTAIGRRTARKTK